MASFKCISCGEIKESEQICSCPTCGYRMFELPYVRKEILISEIGGFISRLELDNISRENLVFEGKEKDDKRFPDYDKILKYVSSKDRTEDFFENLLETAAQLKTHFSNEFSKTYPVSFEKLDDMLKQYDEVLIAAAHVLSPTVKIHLFPVEWKNASLIYTDTPNKYLWASAKQLLDMIENLAKKIVKFIKVNNLYGDNHKYHPK